MSAPVHPRSPGPVWFTGRDAVTRFLARRAFAEPGDMVLVPTAANGQPAVAEYRRAADNVMRAHSIQLGSSGSSRSDERTIGLQLRVLWHCRAGAFAS